MRSDRLNDLLRKMHGSGTTDQTRKDALEANLLSRYRELHPQNRRWLMLLNPWSRSARFAALGAIFIVFGVVACSTETTTEVELGKNMQIGIEARAVDPSFDLIREAGAMSDLLTAQPGVDDASVSISQQGSGEVTLNMLVWGTDLNADNLVSALQAGYPSLSGASVWTDDLKTTVKESYAAKWGREMLSIEASGSDPEALRQQVLEQLAAQGYTGDATVDVQENGDQRTITIEVEAEDGN